MALLCLRWPPHWRGRALPWWSVSSRRVNGSVDPLSPLSHRTRRSRSRRPPCLCSPRCRLAIESLQPPTGRVLEFARGWSKSTVVSSRSSLLTASPDCESGPWMSPCPLCSRLVAESLFLSLRSSENYWLVSWRIGKGTGRELYSSSLRCAQRPKTHRLCSGSTE